MRAAFMCWVLHLNTLAIDYLRGSKQLNYNQLDLISNGQVTVWPFGTNNFSFSLIVRKMDPSKGNSLNGIEYSSVSFCSALDVHDECSDGRTCDEWVAMRSVFECLTSSDSPPQPSALHPPSDMSRFWLGELITWFHKINSDQKLAPLQLLFILLIAHTLR